MDVKQSFDLAHEIYQNVLEKINDDDCDANLCLGLLYSKGLGVEQSHTKAMEYFKRSGITVNTYTYNFISDAYNFGNGVDVDAEKAMD